MLLGKMQLLFYIDVLSPAYIKGMSRILVHKGAVEGGGGFFKGCTAHGCMRDLQQLLKFGRSELKVRSSTVESELLTVHSVSLHGLTRSKAISAYTRR